MKDDIVNLRKRSPDEEENIFIAAKDTGDHSDTLLLQYTKLLIIIFNSP